MTKGTYVYGRHAVSELLRGRPQDVLSLYVSGAGGTTRLSDLVHLAKQAKVPVVEANKRKLGELVGPVIHQGVVASVRAFAYASLDQVLGDEAHGVVVALDQVQDPHNLGAIVRSAYALGARGLLLPKDRNADMTPAAIKTAAGAAAHLPVAQVTNLRRALEEAKGLGYWIVGTAASAPTPLWSIDRDRPWVVVIGSEGRGMREKIEEACDMLVQIPLTGQLGSLNASVAAGIALYELGRAR